MTTETAVALEPLRAALFRRAREAAADLRADAERQARAIVDAAEQQAAARLAQVRSEGEAVAAQLEAQERGRSHQAARGVVLAAQRAVYDDVRSQTRDRVRELLADPERYQELAETLRRELGQDAAISEHPGGGVLAEAPDGRRIDASVDVLVDRALSNLALEQLWSSR
jgi:vacuolar-type H+-ATPase subunit E/Vma4